MSGLRDIDAPFVADPATGVCIRTRLKGLTVTDVWVLGSVGEHLGRLAAADLAERVADGLDHDKDGWAERKRDITAASTARWAGSITKATHDQWALARRAQAVHIGSLRDGVAMIEYRLSLPLGVKGTGGMPGGYRSRHEWFVKSRRLATLRCRLADVQADYAAGRVSVVRGGKQLLHRRHHLEAADLTEAQWRARWESARWFLAADGETGKKYGNETLRVSPDGQVSVRLPAPLSHFANAGHHRYILTGTVVFAHRGDEWADRVAANHAVAYRMHYQPDRDRFYLDVLATQNCPDRAPGRVAGR